MAQVVVISSSFPYPVDIGRKVVMAGFLDYLASRVGLANVLFVTLDTEGDETLMPMRLRKLSLGPTVPRAAATVWKSLIRQHKPIQQALLYSKSNMKHIADILAQEKPDILLVDTVRMAQYVDAKILDLPKAILYLDDLYSLRYHAMLDMMVKNEFGGLIHCSLIKVAARVRSMVAVILCFWVISVIQQIHMP